MDVMHVFLTKNPTIPPTWTESEFARAKIGCITFVQNQLHDDVFRQVSGHTELYELLNAIGSTLQYQGESVVFQYRRQLNSNLRWRPTSAAVHK